MNPVVSYPMSAGDVKWGIAFIGLLCLLFLGGALVGWFKFRRTRAKKELLGVVFCGLFAIGMIPAEMTVRSFTSTTIVLAGDRVSVLRRPMCKDESIEFKNIATYRVTTLTQLGGLGKTSGYSDGTERIGWFRMHQDHRKVFACSIGDVVLLIEGKQGEIFLLAPPDPKIFVKEFQKRMGNLDGVKRIGDRLSVKPRL